MLGGVQGEDVGEAMGAARLTSPAARWGVVVHIRRLCLVLTCLAALLGLVVPSATSAELSSRPVGSVSFNGAVKAMVTQGSTVYVVGAFTRATDAKGEHVRRHVAAVDTATGRLLPWHSGINGTPLAVSRYRNQLFVGGSFTRAGGVAVSGLAQISTDTGRVASSFRPRVNATVRALASTKHAVYVGGSFTRVNGVRRPHLAAVARGSGSPLAWRPRTDATVSTLELHRGSIYAGGDFETVNGKGRAHLVALRPDGAGKIRAAFRPRMAYPVTAVTFAPHRIFVAQAGPGGRLSALRPSGGRLWERTFDGDAVAVAVLAGRVYVGGHWVYICSTSRVGGPNGDCVDGKNLRPKLASYTLRGQLTTWNPDPDSYSVWALARARAQLAVGGDFDHFGSGAVTQAKFALFFS